MLTRIALALSLLVGTANAKPLSPAEDTFVTSCVHERTGPTGGIPPREALKLCRGIVKHQHRIDRTIERIRKAILACEQAVSDACVDSAETDGSTDCTAPALFDVCHPARTEP
jgi:hypothetical protein